MSPWIPKEIPFIFFSSMHEFFLVSPLTAWERQFLFHPHLQNHYHFWHSHPDFHLHFRGFLSLWARISGKSCCNTIVTKKILFLWCLGWKVVVLATINSALKLVYKASVSNNHLWLYATKNSMRGQFFVPFLGYKSQNGISYICMDDGKKLQYCRQLQYQYTHFLHFLQQFLSHFRNYKILDIMDEFLLSLYAWELISFIKLLIIQCSFFFNHFLPSIFNL